MGKTIALLALVTVVALILSHLRTKSLRAFFKRRIEGVHCTLWQLNFELSVGVVTVVEVRIEFGDEILRLSREVVENYVMYRAWDSQSSVTSAFWSETGDETGMEGLAKLVEDAIEKRTDLS